MPTSPRTVVYHMLLLPMSLPKPCSYDGLIDSQENGDVGIVPYELLQQSLCIEIAALRSQPQ